MKEVRREKMWERDWIAKRREYGAYHGLLREMRESDPAAYRNFLRMDDESFRTLLQSVAASIQRQDTTLRKAIPPEERLSLTLRYLATGKHYVTYYVA